MTRDMFLAVTVDEEEKIRVKGEVPETINQRHEDLFFFMWHKNWFEVKQYKIHFGKVVNLI